MTFHSGIMLTENELRPEMKTANRVVWGEGRVRIVFKMATTPKAEPSSSSK